MEKKLPNHIGFIMDGNGRWAKKRSLPRVAGHKEGANAFRTIVKRCKDLQIPFVTFFAFSTENWNRPREEIDTIFHLFDQYMNEVRKYSNENVRLRFLGDKSMFSQSIREKMNAIEKDSKSHSGMTLMIAVNYGGRDDILQAVKNAALLPAEMIDQKVFGQLLYTGDAPDLDLIIRPSGEQRISNFMLWQAAYAELYFTDVLWPDFDSRELDKALTFFSLRQRRFGGILDE